MTAMLVPPRTAPVPTVIRLTEEEFLARYAGKNAELVDGIVKEYPMAGLLHGFLCTLLARLIGNFVEDQDLGRVMSNDSWVRIANGSFRGGDVLFFSWERLPRGVAVPTGVHTLSPELVVEVKSPTDRWGDIFVKVGEYLNADVRVIVVVDPETATVSLYRPGPVQTTLQATDTLTVPDVLPGFSIPVARLFS